MMAVIFSEAMVITLQFQLIFVGMWWLNGVCQAAADAALRSGLLLLVHISLHGDSQTGQGAGERAGEHGQHTFAAGQLGDGVGLSGAEHLALHKAGLDDELLGAVAVLVLAQEDRKSTRLNSSHVSISYAVFCLKKQK